MLGKCVNNYTNKEEEKAIQIFRYNRKRQPNALSRDFFDFHFDFKTLHCRLNNQKEPDKKATYLIKDKLEKHDNIEENPKKKPKRLLN